MQTKLSVFLAFLAFLHVSYCHETTAAPVPAVNDVQRIIQQYQQHMTSIIGTILGHIEQVFSVEAESELRNSISNSTGLNPQQIRKVVEETFGGIYENLQTALSDMKLPQLEFSKLGDLPMKAAEILPATLEGILPIFKTVLSGTKDKPATVSPQ